MKYITSSKFKYEHFHVYYVKEHFKMDIDGSKEKSVEALNKERVPPNLIVVRAIMQCKTCGTKKKFRNQFLRKDLELMIVALKVFDWMTCQRCGELFKLDLEFSI